MATIGEETERTVLSTNVIDDTPYFDNTLHLNYPIGTRYQFDDILYSNESALEPLLVPLYDPLETSYVKDQIIFIPDNPLVPDVGFVNRITETDGVIPTQPTDYPAVDTSFNEADWLNRYMKVTDMPAEPLGDSYSLSGMMRMFWKPDGLKVFRYDGRYLREFDLTVAFDLDTIGAQTAYIDIGGQIVDMSDDGTKIYRMQGGIGFDPYVLYLGLGTAWDLASHNITGPLHYLANTDISPYSISVGNNGTKMYVTEVDFDIDYNPVYTLHEYTITTTLSSIVAIRSIELPSDAGHSCYEFSPDGEKFYSANYNTQKIQEYHVTTGWNISDLTRVNSITANGINTRSITIHPDGDVLWENGLTDQTIYKYTIITPWSLEGAYHNYIPYTYEEIRGDHTYTYILSSAVSIVKLTSTGEILINKTQELTTYEALTNNTPEEDAYIETTNGVQTWLPKTLIITEAEAFIRTNVEAPIIYIDVTEYQFAVVVSPEYLTDFMPVGITNNVRPFDGTNITPAEHDGTKSDMIYTVQGDEEFNAFTLAKVLATSITYSFNYPFGHSEYGLWLDGVAVANGGNGIVKTETKDIDCTRDAIGRLSLYPTTVVYYADTQMAVDKTTPDDYKYPSVTINLSYDGLIQLGDFTFNNTITGGLTNLEFSHSIQDFNTYTPDPWGNIPEGTKAVVTKFNITVDIELENYDHVVSLHESLVRKFVTIDASDSINGDPNSISIFASLIRRVRITSVSHKTIVKDGDMWVMAGVTLSVQEIV